MNKSDQIDYCGWCGVYLGDYDDWKECLCPKCKKTYEEGEVN